MKATFPTHQPTRHPLIAENTAKLIERMKINNLQRNNLQKDKTFALP